MAKKPFLKLRRRLNAPEDNGGWLCKEIAAICKAVGIPQEQIGEYFFPTVTQKNGG